MSSNLRDAALQNPELYGLRRSSRKPVPAYNLYESDSDEVVPKRKSKKTKDDDFVVDDYEEEEDDEDEYDYEPKSRTSRGRGQNQATEHQTHLYLLDSQIEAKQ